MESTAMGLLRGTAIVAFVLGLPAIALFGVPPEVRAFLESDMLPWNSAKPASHDDEQAAEEGVAPASDDHLPARELAAREPSFFARTDSIQANHERDLDASAEDQIALASAEARVLHRPVYRPLGAGEKTEVVRHLPSAEPNGDAQTGASDASAVMQIEAQLRQLGAISYQLQQQSGAGRYRFVCVCAGDEGQQRTFEATSADRLEAMRAVLDQVNSWRSSFFTYSGFQR